MNDLKQGRELKKITGAGLTFLMLTLLLSVFHTNIETKRSLLLASDEPPQRTSMKTSEEFLEAEVVRNVSGITKPKSSFFFQKDEMVEKYIVIPKPDKKKRLATLTENYVYHTVFLDIEGDFTDYYHPDLIERVVGEKIYKGEPELISVEPYLMAYINDKLSVGAEEESAYNEAIVRERKYDKDADPLLALKKSRIVGKMNGTRLALTCNRIYVPELFEDEDNYYISLKRPKDVYEKIIVIDAGHGGRHPGTLSLDGAVIEKDTTLRVVKFLKSFFDSNDEIKVYYTRLNDATVYLRPRADLANETEADFFISIHNNSFDTGHAFGTEVFYNETLESGTFSPNYLAELMLNKVTEAIGSRSRGTRGGSEKYVLGHTNMMSALIEIGYLTNQDDLRYILDDEKMKKCAEAIYDSVVIAYKEMKK